MADLAKNYGPDKDAEMNGVWENLADDIRIKVARIGNPVYQKIWEREIRPYRAQMDRNLLSDEKSNEILTKVMAEAVLLDWENIEYKGKKFPYTKENAIELLNEFPDFRADVMFLANQQATFRADEIETAEKNSSKS